MFKKYISWCAVVWIYLLSFNLYAAEDGTGWRKIVDIGCHNVDAICFVTLDGPSFGTNLSCPVSQTNEFRFDNNDTPIGRRTFAALLAAYLSGKKVAVSLEGCSIQGYPLIKYFHISD